MGNCLTRVPSQSTQYQSVSIQAVSNTPVTDKASSIPQIQRVSNSTNNSIVKQKSSISAIQTNDNKHIYKNNSNSINRNDSIKIKKPLPKIENGEEFVKFLMAKFCPNPTISSKVLLDNYFKKLNSHFSKALNYLKTGKDIKSYIELMRFCQLYTALSKHNSFRSKQYEKLRNLNKKRCDNALTKLEQLKPKLIERYDQIKQNKMQQNKNRSNTDIYKETAGEILEYIHQIPSAPIIQTDEGNNILLEQQNHKEHEYPTPKQFVHSEKHQVADDKILEHMKQNSSMVQSKQSNNVIGHQYPTPKNIINKKHENMEQNNGVSSMLKTKHLNTNMESDSLMNINGHKYPTPNGMEHEIEEKKSDNIQNDAPNPMNEWKYKKISKWTNENIANWIKSMNLEKKWNDKLINEIQNCQCTGKDIKILQSATDIADSFGINNKPLCRNIAMKIKNFKPIVKKKKVSNKPFRINIFSQQKHIILDELLTKDATVQYVKVLYKIQSGVVADVDDIQFYYQRKLLPSDKTLEEVNIVDEKHLISVQFKTDGAQ